MPNHLHLGFLTTQNKNIWAWRQKTPAKKIPDTGHLRKALCLAFGTLRWRKRIRIQLVRSIFIQQESWRKVTMASTSTVRHPLRANFEQRIRSSVAIDCFGTSRMSATNGDVLSDRPTHPPVVCPRNETQGKSRRSSCLSALHGGVQREVSNRFDPSRGDAAELACLDAFQEDFKFPVRLENGLR